MANDEGLGADSGHAARPPKRLIGVDLDGTILRGSDHAQPDDLRALLRAQEMGIPVIVATGRSHFSSTQVVAQFGFNQPHACYDGAWILTPEGERLRDLRVDPELAREVLQRCKQIDIAVRVFMPESIVLTREPGPDEIFFKYRPYESVDPDIENKLGQGPMQLVIVHLNDIRVFLAEFSGGRIEKGLHWMLQGHDPETPHLWALHLFHPGGTKDAALAQLCAEWGIERENVLAFGDGPNDVSMLRWAGTGVSFPWGVEDARRAADVITTPNDPHPIATIVDEWLEGS